MPSTGGSGVMTKNPPAKSLSDPKHKPQIIRGKKGKGSYRRTEKKNPVLPNRYFWKGDGYGKD